MKKTIKTTAILIITFIMGLIIGLNSIMSKHVHALNDIEYANYKTLTYKIALINALKDYYVCAHNIYTTKVDSTGDTFDCTDQGVEYWNAWDRVDSLLNLESIGDTDNGAPYDWE